MKHTFVDESFGVIRFIWYREYEAILLTSLQLLLYII